MSRSKLAGEKGLRGCRLGWVELSKRQYRAPLLTAARRGEGRRRGKQAGPQRYASEGKLNKQARDQDDRWHQIS